MKLFGSAKPVSVTEQRAKPRTRVDCFATLAMPSGERQGRLYDISTDGARFVTDSPPAKGASAILDWDLHEAYCHVIWTKPGMCGVQFDRPISAKAVQDLAEAAPAGPRLVHPAGGDAGGGSAPPTRFVG
ncbi:PilZ domain-containing protein [Aurantiacibacter gilvus]|uniref:PilZ domain-containing protein n=1 Tax=Aurantiacibacter gilvus TaxID=3139141 RepID=A0ABU9IDA0_9SPHN